MAVHLGGSRSLPPQWLPLVSLVVQAVQQSGQAVHVGCSVGADQQVIQSGIARPSFLVVFAAFASSGAGSWSGSALGAVSAAAARGALVHWLAGGSLAVPLVGRLIRRSQAALAGCSASVFFEPGPGSLAVAGFAVKAGQPVFAFAPSGAPQAPRGCAGHWVPSLFVSFSCWQWQPVAIQQSLL